MRILVFFDLPVVKVEDRKNATSFRKFLLKDGYDMLQYSIYCRICNGYDAVKKHEQRLKVNLPPKGSVRELIITEKQYGTMKFMVGKPLPKEMAVGATQLSIF